ncbi:MAG: hypothetical protein EZS28_049456, partial [Streblomastix strix]
DASGHTLATYDVTLKKSLPSKFPVDGLKLESTVIEKGATASADQDDYEKVSFLTNLVQTTPGFADIKANLAVSLEYIENSGISHTLVVIPGGTIPPEWRRGQDITVTVAYNFGANVSATQANYVALSDLKYKLRFTSNLDLITYNWSDDKSWDGQLVYSRTSQLVKKNGEGSLDLRLSDITAKKVTGTATTTTVLAPGVASSLYGVAGTLSGRGKGTLRLLDAGGNYTDIAVDIAVAPGIISSSPSPADIAPAIAAGSILLPTTPVSAIKSPAGGTSSVTPATFAPVKAVFYLKNVEVTAGTGTATLDVEVIGFNVSSADEKALTTITKADIVKASDLAAAKAVGQELFDPAGTFGTTFTGVTSTFPDPAA